MQQTTYTGLNQTFLMDWKRVNIEASTRCNLLCPGCARTQEIELGNGLAGGIGDMDIEVFKLLVRPMNLLLR